jgi:hypothetical protein
MKLPLSRQLMVLQGILNNGFFQGGWHTCLDLGLILFINPLLFSLGNWPKNKHGEKANSGGRSEAWREKTATEAVAWMNTADQGMPLGCTKNGIINIALCEEAMAHAHERVAFL